jgi:hypothetical protein
MYPSSTKKEQVYRHIVSMGDYGSTDEELQEVLDMGANTQRPRRRELVQEGKVQMSGKRRRTNLNRWSIVWVARKS